LEPAQNRGPVCCYSTWFNKMGQTDRREENTVLRDALTLLARRYKADAAFISQVVSFNCDETISYTEKVTPKCQWNMKPKEKSERRRSLIIFCSQRPDWYNKTYELKEHITRITNCVNKNDARNLTGTRVETNYDTKLYSTIKTTEHQCQKL